MFRSLGILGVFLVLTSGVYAAPLQIITLGDSITRGVRTGVTPEQTFSAVLEQRLREAKFDVTVTNLGIGGERTDQALKRYDKAVLEAKPDIVIIMYGHNDSHYDTGKTAPRLAIDAFEANLRMMIEAARKQKIRPVLMTPPRGGTGWKNGNGVNPNAKLGEYSAVIRKVAADTQTPLIDHYDHWARQEKAGATLAEWTTDQYHANPRGHREMAELMEGRIRELLKK